MFVLGAVMAGTCGAAEDPPGASKDVSAIEHRHVTIATICLLEGEPHQNADHVIGKIEQACEGADNDLVVVPHTPFLKFRTKHARADLQPFAELADRHEIYLALALSEIDGDRTYATSVLLDRTGTIVFKARKTHALPDDDELALGNTLDVYRTDFGVIGLSIGTDIYFPELYEVLRVKGAEILVWQHFPERIRDHATWQPLLAARAIDSHAHLVTAHYANERPYLTHHYRGRMPGTPYGRSMVINRIGIPVADTGIQAGVARATVDLDHRAQPSSSRARNENQFYVKVTTDRKAFQPLLQEQPAAPVPDYSKRTARVAVIHLNSGDMWRDGRRPERLLELLDQAAKIRPDIVLASEQQAHLDDPVTQESMKRVAERAAAMDAYVCIGGLRTEELGSTAHLWNREGDLVWTQPIYWHKGVDEIRVFDTDFARIGAHSCGDIFAPFFDRTLALRGAELILDPSLMWGPDGRTNETLLRARAIDNGVWVACAHWNASDPKLRSVIADPYGQIVSASGHQQDGIIHYDVDFRQRRIYYAGDAPRQPRSRQRSLAAYRSEQLPQQKSGWQEMIFSRRRPELYEIIPTDNEVVRQYRGGN